MKVKVIESPEELAELFALLANAVVDAPQGPPLNEDEAVHQGPHDEASCLWCLYEQAQRDLVQSREELQSCVTQNHMLMGLLWAVLQKHGPLTITNEELKMPKAMISIERRTNTIGIVLTARQESIQ